MNYNYFIADSSNPCLVIELPGFVKSFADFFLLPPCAPLRTVILGGELEVFDPEWLSFTLFI